jgi:chromosome segregation ATPase
MSNNGNASSGPVSSQQQRQPPSGGNGHRKSSSLNRGWFEGTMEVISGMAPRPVTPSQSIRSASAPNSPARGLGMGLFGSGGRNSPHNQIPPYIDRSNSGGSGGGGSFNLPSFPINRLPSQDSLDRSIHNESGHGKSTAQIVADLKKSNSALSAKMASLEKRHMNELAHVEGSSSKRRELEQISAKQKMKLMQYEQYKAAAESKMKQLDSELSKVKEESAFQRHNISDLKNQLYQLQQEMDERDEEDGDEDDLELRRPHSDDGHHLPRHPGSSRGNGGPDIVPTTSTMTTDELQQMALDNEELVQEVQELQDQLMEYQGYDKKLKDLQRQLEAAQKISNGNDSGIPPRPTTPTQRPPLAPSKSRDQDEGVSVDHYRKQLQDLEAEKESLSEAHSRRVEELEDRFVALEEESKERELALRKELTSLSQQEMTQVETRVREQQQEQVVELEEQLEQYAEKLAEVAATLAESRQQAKNQEQYRKDEAEDLRMIQDAHESEIARLEKELDEATKELELRDEELEEVKQKQFQEKDDEKKTEESDTKEIADNDEVKKLELQLESLRKDHNEAVAKLEMENTKLAIDLKKARETEADSSMDKSQDSAGLHQYWEDRTNKTQEVDFLKKEIEKMRHRVSESSEAGKLAEQKVKTLESELKKYRRQETSSNSNELSEENENVEKELQEARKTLVALDDDKQAMHETLNGLVSSLEKEKNVQLEMRAQLKSKEGELAELQEEVQTLKNSPGRSARGDSLDHSSPSVSSEVKGIKQKFERQIEQLNEEKNLVKTKLKDRDTTIATLLRSSIVLENKIESLQDEVDESRVKCEKTVGELQDLRSTQVSRDEEFSKADEEVKYLKGQLKIARVDAKRWKHALKEDGTSSGEYRYQISMLQKANEDFAETIQERDQAIQNLVNQSMGQESHVRDLKIRISSLMKEVESVRMKKGRNDEGALRAEIDRLQEESEIFAGQIIEQDEEFKRVQRVLVKREEQIRRMKAEIEGFNQGNSIPDQSIIQSRDRQISELQKKIQALERRRSRKFDSNDPVEVRNLRAELDEMQEAAESNRVEIRDLRQQLWKAKDAAGFAGDLRVQLEQARKELNEYNNKIPFDRSFDGGDDLNKALARIKELEVKLIESSETETKLNGLKTELEGRGTIIKDLRERLSNVCTISEELGSTGRKGDALDERVTSLTENIKAMNECNDTLNRDIGVLTKENENLKLQIINSSEDQKDTVADLLEEKKGLITSIENLKEKNVTLAKNGVDMEESIKSLKADVDNLSQGAAELEELKLKLYQLETQRESSERSVIEKYEKQLQSLSLSKDAEMDDLRNSLTESREQSSEDIGHVIVQLKNMEHENHALRNQFELEMQAKDQTIYALEHTLHAQEQMVATMRSEMDQIQGGMELATRARRNEVEEMQQEVMQVESKAMKQEREIVSLKMQLEERKLEHKADVVKLKDALAKAMEHDSPLKQTISGLQNNDRMLEVRERLEQLKARNTALQEENLSLGGRLERAAIQINAFEVEKQQVAEVDEENAKLRQQLKEYEQLMSKSSKGSRNASLPKKSNVTLSEKDGKKKKKFGLFKKRSVDESILEEEEC